MKIPLVVIPTNDKLIIYHNGQELQIDHPLKPFVLAQKDKFPTSDAPVEKWIKVPEYEEREYVRFIFADLESYSDFRKRNIDKQSFMMVNNFIEQLYISKPDYLFQYPHTNDLKILFFDIEVASKGDGFFPKPITNEILCIGYSVWLYKNDGKREKIKHKIIKGFNLEDQFPDKKLLIEFINDVKTEDPDVIAGYNSQEFDLPYIIDRCKIIGIEMKGIGRHNKAPYMVKDLVRIPGRIHFDIYNSNAGVHKDQTLFGIKSRTLKEIARFYKAKRTELINNTWHEENLEDIEIKDHLENLVELYKTDPNRLYAYLDDDIYRTEWVGHVYMRNCITLAEMLGVPLNTIITMYSSFVPKLFLARNMEQKRLIATDSNFQRYNINNGSIAKLGTKYEGALVGLYKNGYFPQVYKLDFSSMYPSSIQTWNLGPDTTSFVKKLPFTGKYTFKRDSKYNWYRIPDANFKCDILIKVRNDVEGVLKVEISKLRAERVKIKKQLKTATEAERPTLDSQQYAIKVILNCFHPDTEIMTEHGIKLLKDVKVGERVWSINTKTGKSELKEVEKTYEYDIVNQDFYNITHQRFSQGITEGHKLLGINKNEFFFEEAKDFVKRTRVKIPSGFGDLNIPYDYVYLLDYINNIDDYELIIKHTEDLRKIKSKFKNVSFKKQPTLKSGSLITSKWGEEIKNICRNGYVVLARNKRSGSCSCTPIMVDTHHLSNFIGYYLSKGNLYSNKTKQYKLTNKGISEKINISKYNCNKEIKNNIKDNLILLLKSSLKCKLHENDKEFSFSSDLYADFIKTNLGTHLNKFISNRVFNTLDLELIQDAMYQGGGTKKQRKYIISCKNKTLFNSYLELLIRCGKTFSYSIDSGCYRIVDKKSDITLKKSNTTKTKYSGKVYSLTVKDNHTVYAGINGKMGWIGQSIYGTLGLKSSTYGDMISAIMVTAMCRWLTIKVMQLLKDKLVEVDTDGYILDKEVDIDEINELISKLILTKFNINDNYMKMELEDFGRAYFYAMKNYILEENDRYIIHGSSFKASRAAKVVDRAVDLAIQHVFNGLPKEEVLDRALDFRGLTLEDFEERIKLSKEPREYDDTYDMKLFLSKQMEMKTGQVATRDTQISYVVAKKPLPFSELKPYYKTNGKNYTFVKWIDDVSQLDLNYYEDLVLKALDKFGIKKNIQLSLFGDEFDSKPSKAKKLDVVPTEDIEIEHS